jgi:uncharacterized protein (DUF4415 family)
MKRKSASNRFRGGVQRSGRAKKTIKFTPDHPEAARNHIVRGIVRHGLKSMPAKAAISLRIDADVLEWFRSQGPGYQTRINALLRSYMEASAGR